MLRSFRRKQIKMLVKLGLTLVVVIAVGLYYVADKNDGNVDILGWKLRFDALQSLQAPLEAKTEKQDPEKENPDWKSPKYVKKDKKFESGDEKLEKDPKDLTGDEDEISIASDSRAKDAEKKDLGPKKSTEKVKEHKENVGKPGKEQRNNQEELNMEKKGKPKVQLTKQDEQDEIKEEISKQDRDQDKIKREERTKKQDTLVEENKQEVKKGELKDKLLSPNTQEDKKDAGNKQSNKVEDANKRENVASEQERKIDDTDQSDTTNKQKKDNLNQGTKQKVEKMDQGIRENQDTDVDEARVEALMKKAEAETGAKKVAKDSGSPPDPAREPVHLAVVACGDRLEETLVMIKSALLFSRSMLHVHIFADDELRPQFKQQLDGLPSSVQTRFQHHIYPIQFPDGTKPDEWKSVFKPCATQRLFIPDILMDVRRLLYVDTDILFLGPIEDTWNYFNDFNQSQIVALAWEHEDGSAGWYNRFARHPYYPPFGVNSGVMLMDLPGLRAASWTKLMKEYYREYKLRITWGDQDLINIFFHYYPEKLYVFRCPFNYRPDHCMYMQICKPASSQGVQVLHGSRGVYHNEKQITFRAIYQSFKEYEFGQPLNTHLLETVRTRLEDIPESKDRCAKTRDIFTKHLEQSIKNTKKLS